MKKPDEANTEFNSPRPTLRGAPAIDPNAAAKVAAEVKRAKKDGGIITDFEEAMGTAEIAGLLKELKKVDRFREKNIIIIQSLLRKLEGAHKNADESGDFEDGDIMGDTAPINIAPTHNDWAAAIKAADDSGAFECLSEPIHLDEARIIDTPPPAEELVEPDSPVVAFLGRRRPTREDLKAVVVNHEAKHGLLRIKKLERLYCQRLVESLGELPDEDRAEILRELKEETKAKIIKILAEGENVETFGEKAPPRTVQEQAWETRAETRHTITLSKKGVKMKVSPKKKD